MNYLRFTERMIPDASALLAQRHGRNRIELSELPVRFETMTETVKAIQTLQARQSASGFAAMRDGRLIAYLIGETIVQPWGRCGYIYLPGYGLAERETPEIFQDLYALLGEEWNQKGCFHHYAYICAADKDIVETWFNLGFGKARVDALLDLRSAKIPEVEMPAGISIRRVVKGDNDYLSSLSHTIWRHQTKAPRWHPMTPEEIMEQPEGWAEIADTESDMAYLAFEGKEAVGSLAFYVYEEKVDDMTIPPHCRYMTAAATKESMRGRGIGTALTWYGLKQIREYGDEYCLTNWQSANLLAARFWPRFGFKPVAFRLARQIDSNIAWAK